MKKVSLLVLCVVMETGLAFSVFGAPEQDQGRWYYRDASGSRVRDTLISIDNGLYYFGSDGALVSNEPVENGGNWYYCDESGRCLTEQWRYCADSENSGAAWHYYMENGRAFENGWLLIGEERYHFTDRCMDHGWYAEESSGGREAVYYLGTENDGKATRGWLAWKGGDGSGPEERRVGWYYFSETGKMISDAEITVGSGTYAFNGDGTMAVGFCRITDRDGKTKKKYYDRKTGMRADGWLYLEEESGSGREEGWYYFDAGESSVPENCTRRFSADLGFSQIDGKWYGFDASGKMITGLVQTEEGGFYCFASDGKLMTGYITVPQDGVAAPAEQMMFSAQGSAPPVLGASVNGELNGYLYRNGARARAEQDNYEQIALENGKISHSYVINENGAVIRTGTVILKNGQKMKIIRQEEGWTMIPMQSQ